jgi:hypothetical protein
MGNNVVALSTRINRGPMRTLEVQLANLVRAGHIIEVDVRVKYIPGTRIASEVTYRWRQAVGWIGDWSFWWSEWNERTWP